MKKVTPLIILLSISLFSFSQKVDISTATKVAQKVLQSEKPELIGKEFNRILPIGLDKDTLLYVFEYSDDGFVVVSGESSAPPVLGYCEYGKYEPANMPGGLLYLIDRYKYEINNLREKGKEPTKQINSLWDTYLNTSKGATSSYDIVPPMLHTTWNQWSTYTPNNCPAGCVAVAMAQILKYWDCQINPDGGRSYTNWYYIDHETGDTLDYYYGASADFGATTYYWTNMADSSYSSDAAELIYHAGVSCETHYKEDGSSSSIGRALDAFEDYWGINSNAEIDRRIFHLSGDDWQTMLENELILGRPIYYRGQTSVFGGSGHAWVIEGYNSEGSFWCNWG